MWCVCGFNLFTDFSSLVFTRQPPLVLHDEDRKSNCRRLLFFILTHIIFTSGHRMGFFSSPEHVMLGCITTNTDKQMSFRIMSSFASSIALEWTAGTALSNAIISYDTISVLIKFIGSNDETRFLFPPPSFSWWFNLSRSVVSVGVLWIPTLSLSLSPLGSFIPFPLLPLLFLVSSTSTLGSVFVLNQEWVYQFFTPKKVPFLSSIGIAGLGLGSLVSWRGEQSSILYESESPFGALIINGRSAWFTPFNVFMLIPCFAFLPSFSLHPFLDSFIQLWSMAKLFPKTFYFSSSSEAPHDLLLPLSHADPDSHDADHDALLVQIRRERSQKRQEFIPK